MIHKRYKNVLSSEHAGLRCWSKCCRLRRSPKDILSEALKSSSAACDAVWLEEEEAGWLRKNAKPARCMAPRSSGKTARCCSIRVEHDQEDVFTTVDRNKARDQSAQSIFSVRIFLPRPQSEASGGCRRPSWKWWKQGLVIRTRENIVRRSQQDSWLEGAARIGYTSSLTGSIHSSWEYKGKHNSVMTQFKCRCDDFLLWVSPALNKSSCLFWGLFTLPWFDGCDFSTMDRDRLL